MDTWGTKITGRIYDETTQRESLLGLEGVSVQVRPLSSAIEADGLSTSDIQAGVEAQLAQAGIAVLPEEKDLCLYVTITGYIYKDVCAFFTVSLEFRQPVMLVRDPKSLILQRNLHRLEFEPKKRNYNGV